ncbi:MAG TPA: phosphotransferase [Acidimicrobiales bacterium]|nr:phosphotransferase [Acidimicrobiales bacterium]
MGAVPDEVVLPGGIVNAGAVVRSGRYLLRPSTPYTGAVHRLLRHVRAAGCAGVPEPVGIDVDGRERLVFIEGDVPTPPYPHWSQTDGALVSVTELLARFHASLAEYAVAPDDAWSEELADPASGTMICHNDVCLENVVFRDGRAVALLDFELAAPGRPLYDLAQLARGWVPVDDDLSAYRLGWTPADRPARLRLVSDAYGLDEAARVELVDTLDTAIACDGEFVRRRVARGDAGFVRMWQEMGGMERIDRRRRWWSANRDRFLASLA